jgi:AraC-like DNA-binding protein
VNYIDEYFYEDIKIETLAKKTGYTCRHFRNLFAKKTGMPPSEYLLKKRIEGSKRLLLTTSQSIVEISLSCGFSSASQFAMLFKRYTQMTPSNFRHGLTAD